MSALPSIMVAPNGARLTRKDHPAVPVTIPQIVECALACQAEGADGIHAHVRDAGQQHVLDAGLYRELLAEMDRALPDFLVQITTEAVGRYTPRQQRQLVRDVAPRAVSIAPREMFADQDDPDLRRFYHDCAEAGMAVQHILYDEEDVRLLARAVQEGVIPSAGMQALIVLGRYAVGQVSSPADLGRPAGLLRTVLPEADWAVCAFGPAETDCLIAAHRMGGKARIGFENNRINKDLSCARDNAERVRELVRALAHLTTA